jgi:PAS domain S-box-containing protein
MPATDLPNQEVTRCLRSAAGGLTVLAFLIGVVALVGWIFGWDPFTQFLPGVEQARPETALAIVLASSSLWLSLRVRSSVGRATASVLGSLVILFGAISLGELVSGRDLGLNTVIRQLAALAPTDDAPRSMASTTKVSLIFLGAALLLIRARSFGHYAVSSLLCFPPMLIAVMVLLGYAYGLRGFYQIGVFSPMVIPVAVSVLSLSLAIIIARPECKPARPFTQGNVTGYASRRLLIVALVIPPVLSGWRLLGGRTGFYEMEFGIALLVLSTMVVFVGIVLYMAGQLGRVEDELELQTSLKRTIVEVAPAALFVLDAQHRVTFANWEVASMFGWSPDEIRGESLHGKLHHRHLDGRLYPVAECPLIRAALDGRVLRDHEDVFFGRDGRAVHVLCSSAPLAVAGGAMGSVLVVQDITERKNAEERLRRSEAEFRAIFEQSAAGVAIAELDGKLSKVNRKYCRLLGYSEAELQELSVGDITHPDDLDRNLELLQKAFAGKISDFSFQKRYLHKEGHSIWVEAAVAPVLGREGKPASWLVVVLDITEQKRGEEALGLAVTRFETLANMIPQFVWSSTSRGEIDYFNDRWYEFTGMSREVNLSRGWLESLHPDDIERTEERWRHSIATGEAFEMTHRHRRVGDGAYRWFIDRAVPIRGADGGVTRWFGTATDIEDQQRQAENLEKTVAERTAVAEGRAEQVRNLSIELTEAEQRERARVARVLHDDLQQILVAAKMRVRRGGESSASVAANGEMDELLSRAIETARSLSKELSPPILFKQGLGGAIQWLGRYAEEQYGFEVEVTIVEAGSPEEEWLRVFLYEMARELLLNVAKHAETKRVRLGLERDENGIRVWVEDEGKGFSPEAMQDSGNSGSGLFFVQKRTAMIGGEATIESARGRGTRIQISVPRFSGSFADRLKKSA